MSTACFSFYLWLWTLHYIFYIFPHKVHVFWLIMIPHNWSILLILNHKRWTDVASLQLIFPRSPCFLLTARLGCSQDSQGTHVATNCCAACKHWPSLTCVYPTTLIYRLLLCPPHRPLKQMSTLIARWMMAVQQWQWWRGEIQWREVISVVKNHAGAEN